MFPELKPDRLDAVLKGFKVHRICFAAGKRAIENIANLDKLPPTGATLYAVPMLIKDGTGAPARVFAVLP